MTSSDAKEKAQYRKKNPFRFFAALAAITFALWLINLGTLWLFGESWSTRGQVGDSFGSINALFSGLAFSALIVTIWMQREELALQREELGLQREEMAKSRQEVAASAKALQEQHRVLSRQSFENTFFQLLRNFTEILEGVGYQSPFTGQHQAGRVAIIGLSGDLVAAIRKHTSAADHTIPDNKVREEYEQFYRQHSAYLGHYFRALYHVFKFVHRSTLEDAEKVVYANIARAQLSDSELVLIFYNGVTGEGAQGLKPLIERYGLLKHVKREQLATALHVVNRGFFKATAFMSAADRVQNGFQ